MRKRAAVLCGAAAVVASGLTAVPAEAGAPHAPETFRASAPAWKKCGTDDYPTLQCASVEVPLDRCPPLRVALVVQEQPHLGEHVLTRGVVMFTAHDALTSGLFSRKNPRSRATSVSISRSWRRPRCNRDITVPIGVPMISAISL